MSVQLSNFLIGVNREQLSAALDGDLRPEIRGFRSTLMAFDNNAQTYISQETATKIRNIYDAHQEKFKPIVAGPEALPVKASKCSPVLVTAVSVVALAIAAIITSQPQYRA